MKPLKDSTEPWYILLTSPKSDTLNPFDLYEQWGKPKGSCYKGGIGERVADVGPSSPSLQGWTKNYRRQRESFFRINFVTRNNACLEAISVLERGFNPWCSIRNLFLLWNSHLRYGFFLHKLNNLNKIKFN